VEPNVSVVTALTAGVAGVVFGLALAAPPGPMNAVIAEESVLRGWWSGFLAGLGAMTADAVFLVLALLGAVSVVEQRPLLRGIMVGIGGVLMLYFAYGTARDAAAGDSLHGTGVDDSRAAADGSGDRADSASDDGAVPSGDDSPPGRRSDRHPPDSRGFRRALALALTNPYQVVFWLTVGVGLLRPGEIDALRHTPYVGDRLAGLLVVQTGSPPLLLGLFGGIVVWIVGFPVALVGVGRRIDRFAPVVAYASAFVLLGFGLLFLVDAAGTLGLV
jgi:threonine/homoserine/homoserine lactone efflux protein